MHIFKHLSYNMIVNNLNSTKHKIYSLVKFIIRAIIIIIEGARFVSVLCQFNVLDLVSRVLSTSFQFQFVCWTLFQTRLS